ncbi:hypothetical protein BD560DRAFT_387421 [Blakeslea trispora]|nr:hypothetical protein BD560DRAFT_387421 [Blakeslea trispora]
MTTIISTRSPTEVFSPKEKMIHEMSLLALNNNYYYEFQKRQLDDDAKSDTTTTVVDSLKRYSQKDWTDTPTQQSETTKMPKTVSSSRFSPQASPTPPSQSKLSLFKSRVRRVFRLSSCHMHSQPSLPVISPTKWNPSMESMSTCSNGSTLMGSVEHHSPHKTCRYRHSMDSIQLLERKQSRRFSSATRLKDRLGRSASLGAIGRYPSKSILKTSSRDDLHSTLCSFQTIENSPIEKKQRWPSKRLSMPLKKKCSMLKRKAKTPKGVGFNKMVDVFETYSKEDYDRSSDPDAVCTRLTAIVANQIKQELNYYKLHEMMVHESSRLHTHFFL